MRRFAHCLILLLAPCSLAWAEDGFDKSQRGACVYSSDSQRPATSPAPSQTSASALPRAPRPVIDTGASNGGGGGTEEDLLQRMRAPRWHSFLPGMFR